MMYFLTNIYRYIKLAVALALFVSGVCVTAYSFSFDSTGLTVLGVLQIIASLLLCGDATKVIADMRKTADDLKKHSNRLESQLVDIDRETGELRQEVDTLQSQTKKKDKQLEKASEQIKKNKEMLEEQKRINKEDAAQLKEACHLNDVHEKENEKLKTEVRKIEVAYQKVKTLVLQMAATEGSIKEAGVELSRGLDRLETIGDKADKTAEVMDRLAHIWSKTKFRDVDANRDGIISKDEFQRYVDGHK